MQRVTPHLWFDSQAEEAANLYVAVFNGAPGSRKASKVKTISRYPKAAEAVTGKPAGSVMTVSFELDGQEFMALNGGPIFKFNESMSFIINCQNQTEIDYFWDKLIAGGGQESQCGWLKDKFGFSWQVVPIGFDELAKDPAKFEKAMAAILTMKKIILADLQAAANG